MIDEIEVDCWNCKAVMNFECDKDGPKYDVCFNCGENLHKDCTAEYFHEVAMRADVR